MCKTRANSATDRSHAFRQERLHALEGVAPLSQAQVQRIQQLQRSLERLSSQSNKLKRVVLKRMESVRDNNTRKSFVIRVLDANQSKETAIRATGRVDINYLDYYQHFVSDGEEYAALISDGIHCHQALITWIEELNNIMQDIKKHKRDDTDLASLEFEGLLKLLQEHPDYKIDTNIAN